MYTPVTSMMDKVAERKVTMVANTYLLTVGVQHPAIHLCTGLL
jgi:hypothetical protein